MSAILNFAYSKLPLNLKLYSTYSVNVAKFASQETRGIDFYAAVEIAYPRFTYGKKIATLEIHLASLAKFCDGAHDFLPCENDLYNSSSGFQRGDYGAKLPFVIVHKVQNFFR